MLSTPPSLGPAGGAGGPAAPGSPLKHRIARSVSWLAWSHGVVQVVSFIVTLVVARWLDPTDYGIMALASVWTTTTVMIGELGLGAAIIQFNDLEDAELNACFWSTVALSGLAYVLLYAVSPLISGWFATPRLSPVLRVVGLTLPIAALRLVPDSLLRKRVELDKVAAGALASSVVTLPVVLGLAWVGAGVWALVAGALVIPSVQCVMSFWFVRWRPGVRVASERLRDLLSYSTATLGGRLCWAAYDQADAVVLGKIAGDSVLGAYSVARQLALLPVEKVSTMINQIAVPSMAEMQTDREAMRRFFLRGTRLVAWITFPMCFCLMILAEDLVRVALTEKWIGAVPVLIVLSAYAAIRSVAVLFPPVLMARYRVGFLFRYNLGLLIAMPAAFCLGALWWGGIGVAWAWVLVYPAMMGRMAHEALREVDLRWSDLWAELRPAVMATAATVLVMWGTRWAISSLGGSGLTRLAATASTGGLTYVVALVRLGGPVRWELHTLAGWVVRPGRALARAE